MTGLPPHDEAAADGGPPETPPATARAVPVPGIAD